MKKTCYLIAWVLAICLCQPVLAQQKISLAKALEQVKATYGTRFSYEEHLLDNVYVNGKLKLSKDEHVENVLKELLYKNGFLFLYIQQNYYTIVKDSRKKAGEKEPQPSNEADFVTDEYVQTVTGIVTGPDGKPLVGATVMPDGMAVRNGVSTNSDGQYILRLKTKTGGAIYSFIGMVPRKVNFDGKPIVNVQLEAEAHELDVVNVVSTGYQSLPKERATGSFAKITAEQIKEVPSINIMEKLEGTTPGVRFDVRNNKISIRGVNTLSTAAGSNPLIVIDGFPAIEQSGITDRLNSVASAGAVLSRYNPEDIESISILKDAAATSIWGAQAANGVIVITTKKGQKNSSKINFSSNLSIAAPANINNLNRMSSADYIDLEREMKSLNFYTDPAKWDNSWMTFNQNKPVSEALEWMFRVDRGTATAQQRDSALAVLSLRDNRTQIRDLLLQQAVSQQYNLSLSGGGQNNTYYVSTNYSKDIPVFRSNKGESYFATANLNNYLFNNRVTVSTGFNYNYAQSQSNQAALNAIAASTQGLRPYEMLQDANGNTIARNILFRDEVADSFVRKGYLPWSYSPLQELNYGNGINKENRLRFTANINTKINKWLSVDVAGALQKVYGSNSILNELNSYSTRVLVNTGTTTLTNGRLQYNVPYGGRMQTTTTNSSNYSLRGQLNINKNWDNFSLNAVAGTEIREDKREAYQQTRYGYNEDTRTSASFNPTTNYNTIYGWSYTLGYSDGSINSSINRFLSYYTNAALSAFNNKYVLSGSLRFDDMSMLGISRSKRAKPLWSAGVKWNALAENFMKDISWLSTLNVRLTYGTGGTVPLSASNAAQIAFQGNDNVTNEPYGYVAIPANNQVSWEMTHSGNLGLDVGFFHNRLLINADIYRKKTTDILWNFPVNPTYGWSSLQFNSASMKGHGYEFGISGQILNGKQFQWNSSFNFSYNTNEVTDSRFTQPTAINLISKSSFVVGMPTDYLYAYRWAGLDNTGQSQIYDKTGKALNSSVVNTTITPDDLVYMGRTTPPYFGGWMNNFTYKGFTLGVRITYEMGHVFRKMSIDNYPDYITTSYSGLLGTQQDLALRWRQAGDEAFTNVPGLANVTYNSIQRYKNADLLVLSGSHIRLQQVSLGYQFAQQMIKKTPFKSASVNLSVRNLGIIWRKNKEGIDPSYIQTNNYSNLPPTAAYFFGINVGF